MPDRDVAAFDRRAAGYDRGLLGQMHQRLVHEVAEAALAVTRDPRQVLDVGCGTGTMLRLLAGQLPAADLFGVDPATSMLRVAAHTPDLDPRVAVLSAAAENLPFADHTFDLIVSTTSFDHWADQLRGLRECARVLRPGAPLVLCDLFSPMLVPTLLIGHRGRTRTQARARALLTAAGFASLTWHRVLPMIKIVIATSQATGRPSPG